MCAFEYYVIVTRVWHLKFFYTRKKLSMLSVYVNFDVDFDRLVDKICQCKKGASKVGVKRLQHWEPATRKKLSTIIQWT